MTTESGEEINIYSIAVRYFEKAQKYLCAAKKHDRASIEHDALLSMAIISYYCPFTRHYAGTKNKRSKLMFDRFGYAPAEQRKFHENCEEFRNKALAHPDFKYNPTRFTKRHVFSGSQFSILNQNVDLEIFDNVLARLISVCHEKMASYARSPPEKSE